MIAFQGHTPGPWEVHRYSHANDELWLGIGKRVDHSGPICNLDCTATQHNLGYDVRKAREACLKKVAECKYLVTDEKEQLANAKLIAAAPSLLNVAEAAQDVLDFVRNKYSKPGEVFEFTCEFHQRLNAALKLLRLTNGV